MSAPATGFSVEARHASTFSRAHFRAHLLSSADAVSLRFDGLRVVRQCYTPRHLPTWQRITRRSLSHLLPLKMIAPDISHQPSIHWRRLASWFGARWKVAVVAAACSLFALNSLRDWTALRAFERHVTDVADNGGGALFIFQAADCLTLAEVADLVADTLRHYEFATMGLVIQDTVDKIGLQLVLGVANQRFPHYPVGARSVVEYIARTGTPAVLAIASNGVVVGSERITPAATLNPSALAARLLHGVRGRS